MRKLINTAIIKEGLALTLGIVAAVAILFSQTALVSDNHTSDTETHQSTEDDNTENKHDITTITQDAVSSIAQLTLANGLHFITDIDQNESEPVKVQFNQKIDFNSYFRTLFRLIISPNAP
ncbi:MAG: hypothetical protein ABJH05_03665 [Fulvivirga sp.]